LILQNCGSIAEGGQPIVFFRLALRATTDSAGTRGVLEKKAEKKL